MKDLIWFAKHSWSYLGCNAGTGRWKARLTYVKGFIPAYMTFAHKSRIDRKMGSIT